MSPSETPPDQSTAFPILGGRIGHRPLTARRAAAVISIVTVILTVAGGVAIWLVERDSFSSLGEGMWWSVQTLTTVGYGDVVPTDTIGRVIATVVMLNGIAFLTVITAAVTATLVDQIRRQRQPEPEQDAHDVDSASTLDEINARLASIEALLAKRDRD
jgi:voltage-gated potassium channel